VVLAQSLCRVIAESQEEVADGAERVAIGLRRYVWLASESPAWALLLLDISATNPSLLALIEPYSLADLRLGVKQKRLKAPSEAAALDVMNGIGIMAMRRVIAGVAPARHDVAVATVLLRSLGMAADEAAEVARRPLPELATQQAPEPDARVTRARPATRSRR
jgi:hypothetical protein